MKLKPGPISALAFSLFLAFSPAAGAKEGFGGAKSYVRMERFIPPAVELGQARFAVRMAGAEAGTAFGSRLEAELEKELAARDGGLLPDRATPQIVVELKVLRNELKEGWESKSERERRQIGIDPRNGNASYQSVEVQVQYWVIAYDVTVGFAVVQAAGGSILHAGEVTAPFEGRYRNGKEAPAAATLETEAIGKMVEGIAGRLAAGRETIAVQLPQGRLEPFTALAGAGDWRRYRDAVSALAPSPESAGEAYRQYALATASEALAYAAQDPVARQENLKLAASQYQAAIAANPGEKIFVKKSEARDGTKAADAPLERVQAALASLERSKAPPPPVAVTVPTAPAPTRQVAGGAMDNAAVIEMVRQGKGGYAILTAMKAAPGLAFDFSEEGMAELEEANVDPKVIGYMRQMSGQ